MSYQVNSEGLVTDLPTQSQEERRSIWERLSSVNQDLFALLYGSMEGFLKPPIISPLEPYIIQFDLNMHEEGTVRYLAFRLGMEIPNNADGAVYFYWVIIRVIMVFGLTGQAQPNLPTLRQIINMTLSQFQRWEQEQGATTFPEELRLYQDERRLQFTDPYHQRLLVFLNQARINTA